MLNLPIGIQEFSEFKEGNYIYVDKTEHIYRLIRNKYYFLSRPRRFGKSLLLNTIKEIFFGNKELFKDLWIYDKIDFEPHPVIKMSFSSIDYFNAGLKNAIDDELSKIAEENNINLTAESFSSKFKELIAKLGRDKKVVILIDEYDKPIIDYIEDIPQAEENRKILKNFYSVIKDSDNYIKFFFVTGVSKFSHVSIFSDLNNLNDITLDKNYATLTGYTQEELEHCFPGYLQAVAEDYNGVFDDIMQQIKRWYNGYSWDGKHFVYNPFSILNFLSKREFGDYWYATGTPSFLMKLIKQNNYTIFDLQNKTIPRNLLEKYDISSISLIPLLFQTGYLTIKKTNIREMTLTLDFPNAEVESSFTANLLTELESGRPDKSGTLITALVSDFKKNRIDNFVENLNILFKGISYTLLDDKEKYFHSLFYMVMRLLGFIIETEILTIDGRIDSVVFTDNFIFIIEFKVNQTAETALKQIKEKEYPLKYAGDKRKKILIGINFDPVNKRIDDYISEEV